MRLLALLALAACGPVEPVPGELLVDGISPTLTIDTVAVRNDVVAWTTSSNDTFGRVLHAANTSKGPVAQVGDIGGTSDLVADGDKLYGALDTTIFMITPDAKKTKILTTPEPVVDLFVRTQDGAAELFWTSGDRIYWQGAHDMRPTFIEIANSGVTETELDASADAVFLRSGAGLYRIDRETHVVSTFVKPSDFKKAFPQNLFIEQNRPSAPSYWVQNTRIVGDTAYVLIWEENWIQDFDRGVIVAIPTKGGEARVLVDAMWEPYRFWIDGDQFFWYESHSDPENHVPTYDFPGSLWTARIDGGAASYFMDSLNPVEIDGGYVYSIFAFDGGLSQLRRVRMR